MKKRIFSFLMALILVFGLVPATALTASAASMTTSESGIALIKGFEGFRANAYKDNGQWSIGYGTTSQEGATITEAEADAALRQHVAGLEKKVNEFTAANGLGLTQAQFDALISFSYNCGTAWMLQSGKFRTAVVTKATGNDFLYAISLWGNVGGVPNKNIINRRLAEANLYLNGQYSTTPPANFTYVVLDANGGNVGDDKMQGFDTGKAATIKAAPTHSDSKLSFAGWYTAKSGGTKVTSLSAAHAGKTLYAMWGVKTRITNTYVNVRSGAGTYFGIVGKLYQGNEIAIFETTTYNGALWGRYDGGWLALEYTDYNKPQQELPSQPDSGSQGGSEPVEPEKIIATAVVKCNTYVNVRNQPNTFGTVIVGKLANGTKVDIFEITTVNGHKWGRISTGWFCLDYATLTTGSEIKPEEKPEEKPESGSGEIGTVIRTGFVSHDYVNVRNAAGTVGTTVIGRLDKGDKVNIYEFATVNGRQWARIDGNRWVCMDYVTLDAQNGGTTNPDPNPGTGSTPGTTTVYGAVTVPAGTKVYDNNMKVVKTYASATKLNVSDIAYNPGTMNIYYEVDGGFVEAEGLELTLSVNEKYSTAKELNVYKAAGDSSSVAGSLNKGAVVTVSRMKLTGEILWCYASNGVVQGWIDGEHLEEVKDTTGGNQGGTGSNPGSGNEGTGSNPGSGNEGTGSNPGTGDNTSNEGTGSTDTVLRTGRVSNTYVNVRNAAGTSGTKVVGQLHSGDRVNIYEFTSVNGHQWGRIDGNRWVCMDYITLDSQPGTGSGNGSGNGSVSGPVGGDNTGEGVLATGFVTSTTVNIRTGPGLGYATKGSLNKNTRFSVYEYKLANSMIWGRIGVDKWICLSYTLLDSTGDVTGAGTMGTVIKTGYAVNVRSGPGTGYALMGKIRVNSRIEVYETRAAGGTTWGRISLGWVSMDYVMLDSQLPPGLNPGPGTQQPGLNPGTGTQQPGTGSGNAGNTGNTGNNGNSGNTGSGTVTGPALYTGKVILTNVLNVRRDPTTASANVGTLARNASVTIYEVCASQYMAWGRCDLGWICLTYVDLVPASGNGAVDARVVQYEGLNIREGAGTTYKSVGTYSKGVVVDIYEISGNWGRTDKGWVSLDYLLT